jgi:predicted nucleic-acid-binding protein
MRAVDANVLVRLLTRDDDRQVHAAEAFVEKGAWVSHLVLAEATWVLSGAYDVDDAGIATAVEMLLHHRTLSLQDPDVVAAALKTFQARKKVGFSDCLILEVARKAGHLPLGTFDRPLGKMDGSTRL